MIIVTGSDGFIGRHLVHVLRTRTTEIVHGIDLKSGNDVLTCWLPRYEDVTRVYHLAAITNVHETDAVELTLTNVLGSVRVFEQYRDKCVFASSALVNYPANPYAISKKVGEEYARFYGCSIVRLCTIYGPGGHSFVDECEGEGTEITLYGKGDQVRTYQRVSKALIALIAVEPGKLTILSGWNSNVKDIAKSFGKSKLVKIAPARKGDIQYAPQVF